MMNGATAGVKLASDLTVDRPMILVLAEGKTDGERNNLRGHLFEKFIAILLELYGYEPPSHSSLNITSNGHGLGNRDVLDLPSLTLELPAETRTMFLLLTSVVCFVNLTDVYHP